MNKKSKYTCHKCGNIYTLKNKQPFFNEDDICFFCEQEMDKEKTNEQKRKHNKA